MERVEGPNGRRLKDECDQTGAYGVVHGVDGRILLVQASSGRFYLPGGRIEPFETPEEALVREIEEECGWSASVLEWIGEAVQPIFDGRVSLLATYWAAELVSSCHDRPEHRMLWASPEEALSLLHRESDCSILRSAPNSRASSGLNGSPSRATARQNSFLQSA